MTPKMLEARQRELTRKASADQQSLRGRLGWFFKKVVDVGQCDITDIGKILFVTLVCIAFGACVVYVLQTDNSAETRAWCEKKGYEAGDRRIGTTGYVPTVEEAQRGQDAFVRECVKQF